ncbi:MAG: ABC transporter permease [Ectothiorhodospiraceae bacterium AqS1]|nr:ABC transporter permease [Ectothiorhodospiraceae bacterium AqS1]
MIDLTKLAFRNTLRNTRRTIFTLISITIGCAAMIVFAGFIAFTFEGLRETTIRTELGHFQIFQEGYFERRISDPASVLIDKVDSIEQSIAEIDGVNTVTSRLTFAGIGGVGNATLNMQIIGVDPDRETEFSDFEIVLDGRNLRPGDSDVGVIGESLRAGLGAEIGDWVTILTTSIDGVFNAVDFQIVGVVRTGSSAYDAVFVKLPIGIAKQALGTNAVEKIVVLLDDTDAVEGVSPLIDEALSGDERAFVVKRWDELAEFYASVVRLYSGFFRVFTMIVVIVVVFSVINTMSMSVLERVSEISALRAMGASKKTILALILIEGTILGCIGAALGTAVAFGISAGIDELGGLAMPPPPAMSQGYQAFLSIHSEDVLVAVAVSLASALLSSVLPAINAQKISIVEGLRS